jgi:hypothetical protein
MLKRQCVINKLREIGYSFSDRTKRVEMYKKDGGAQRVMIAIRDKLSESAVRSILRQCGCSVREVERFIADAKV